jgi:5-methylcytosine-specific restriction endonuclease McrA
MENWDRIRSNVLYRDGYTCKDCGLREIDNLYITEMQTIFAQKIGSFYYKKLARYLDMPDIQSVGDIIVFYHFNKDRDLIYERWLRYDLTENELKDFWDKLIGIKFPTDSIYPKKIIFHVHHIDKNRLNNDENNLITLCQNCHILRHKKP